MSFSQMQTFIIGWMLFAQVLALHAADPACIVLERLYFDIKHESVAELCVSADRIDRLARTDKLLGGAISLDVLMRRADEWVNKHKSVDTAQFYDKLYPVVTMPPITEIFVPHPPIGDYFWKVDSIRVKMIMARVEARPVAKKGVNAAYLEIEYLGSAKNMGVSRSNCLVLYFLQDGTQLLPRMRKASESELAVQRAREIEEDERQYKLNASRG